MFSFFKPKNRAKFYTKENIFDYLGAERAVWQTVEDFSDELNKSLTKLLYRYSLELRKAKKDTHYWKKRCERLEKK